MPSRRLRRPPARGSSAAHRSGAWRFAAPALLALTAALAVGQLACTSAGGRGATPPARADFPGLPAADRPYLVDPLLGYPLVVAGDLEPRIAGAYAALREGLVARARAVAGELLAVDPGFHPAIVLAAQADFAAGDPRRAVEALQPVTAELPGYTAAELLLGRAAELGGEPLAAFAAYRRAAEVNALARERVAELKPRAVEIAVNRVRDALARGRLDEADEGLVRLRSWAPDEAPTLEAAADVARARGDRAAELQAVSGLAGLRPDDRAIAERWGELELEAGDPGAGLALFERLAARYPEDRQIAAKLDGAKFRWRFAQLPVRVRSAAAGAEVGRGDFAVLLYWLAPTVRYGRSESARIATDVLDDPRREEIVRVVNLGLMELDAGLHRFSPDAPATRRDALLALLRLAAGAGDGGGGAACVEGLAATARPSNDFLCAAAARCRLIASPADCLPRASLSGGEALELIRRGLDLTR
jgi:tetratricopeptide (TPR) repeat protein